MLQAIVDLSLFTPIWTLYQTQMPHVVKRILGELARETEGEMKRRAPVGATRRLLESIRSVPLSLTAREA